MDLKKALGDIGVPQLARLAAEAPTLNDAEIAAACIYDASLPPGPENTGGSAKIVAVLEDGGLMLLTRAGTNHTVTRVSTRNIANVGVGGFRERSRTGTDRWEKPWLVVDLFRPVREEHHFEFRPLPFEGEATVIYDEEKDAAEALMGVAEALCSRLG